MAHAYTTKRGKNKMSKLGVRKDDGVRAERRSGVSSFISDDYRKFEEPKVNNNFLGLTSGKGNKAIRDAGANSTREVAPKLVITEKCSYSSCTKKNYNKLAECSGCHSVKYCCKECQLHHWSFHKMQVLIHFSIIAS